MIAYYRSMYVPTTCVLREDWKKLLSLSNLSRVLWGNVSLYTPVKTLDRSNFVITSLTIKGNNIN